VSLLCDGAGGETLDEGEPVRWYLPPLESIWQDEWEIHPSSSMKSRRILLE
jgi:hypothetical protein